MAELLTELVAKITTDASELKKGLNEADKSIQSWVKNNAGQIKKLGVAMTAFGVATTAALGLAVKSAEEERQSIALLSAQLDNAGVSYDSVKDSLEGVIAATEAKTNFADDEQRAVLGELILATGDYAQSLSLLPLALDLAAAKQMDASTAAELIGKVAQGNTSVLTRYGIVLKEDATAAEALAAIQDKVAGTAEKTVSPFKVLANNVNNLKESVGEALLPILTDLVKKITPIIQSIIGWIKENPGLTKTILVVVGALGALAAVLGPILIMLPGIMTAIPLLGAAFTAMLGPVGLIIAGIAALIAIGVLVVKNWDSIKEAAITLWNGIADFFQGIWNTIVNLFKNNWDKILMILFPAIGIPMLIARNWEAIAEFFSGLWTRVTAIFANWGENIKSFFVGIWDKIKEIWATGINWIIDRINSVMNLINKIPGVEMGKLGHIGVTAPLSPIKPFAAGGLVTQPTLALVGEAGDEVITPVSELNKPIQNSIYLDGDLIAQIVSRYMDREYRAQMT